MRRAALAGLAAFALAGCGGAESHPQSFSSARYGISMSYPAGWKVEGAGLPAAMTFRDAAGSSRCLLALSPPGRRVAAPRRLAVPLSGGQMLSLRCSSERDLASLSSRLSVRPDRLLDRAQAAVARIDGVHSATVARIGHRLDVSLRLDAGADPEAVARSAVALASRISPQDDLGISAAPPDLRGYALVRWDGGTDRGTIQVGTSPPRPLTLR